jgi:hypothetical protein
MSDGKKEAKEKVKEPIMEEVELHFPMEDRKRVKAAAINLWAAKRLVEALTELPISVPSSSFRFC